MSHTALIILARGEQMLRVAVEAAMASVCDSVIVVFRPEAIRFQAALDGLPLTIADGTSIHAGVAEAIACGADGIVLTTADMPQATTPIFNRLVLTNRATGRPIIASTAGDSVGLPAFFSSELFNDLLALDCEQDCLNLILDNTVQTVQISLSGVTGNSRMRFPVA